VRSTTSIEHLKLRCRALAPLSSAVLTLPIALLTLLVCVASASAAGAGLNGESVSVVGYPVSSAMVATAGAGSPTTQIPALAPAPDGSDAEWVVVSGGRQDLISITPQGAQSMVSKAAFQADNGPPVAYASVDADGYDWILDNDQSVPEDSLYAVGAATSESPGLSTVSTFDGYAQDMTLGSDGALYISDDAGNLIRCQITAAPSASCTRYPLQAEFDGGAYAVGPGGPLVWFTDAAGELGSISSQGTITGPFADPQNGVGALSTDPGTIVQAANGVVYAAGGAEGNTAGNNQIVSFNPASPSGLGIVASGLSNVVALTVGPDGNVWFLDAGANQGAGAVGCLDISTGAVTEYPLPSGVSLPVSGARIAAGPNVPDKNGDGEIFFSATTSTAAEGGVAGTGGAVVGVVTGIPFPIVAGSLQFKQLITVSKRRSAVLTLECDGQTNAECSGRLRLKLPVAVRQKLGAVAYDLRGGQTLRRTVELSGRAFRALERLAGHRVNAQVSVRSEVGTLSGRVLTMVGPAPKRKPKPKHP